MKEVAQDILLFENVLPKDFIKKLNDLVDTNYHIIFNKDNREAKFPFEGLRGRVEVYKFPDLLNEFYDFWYNNIENSMYEYYFQYIKNIDVVEGYKKYARTDWKDVFIQVYNNLNELDLANDIHIDFSGITFIANFKDQYDGGILEFPKQDYRLKLNKGDLILFPGYHTHPHGVTKLHSGERRVLVGQSLGIKQLHKFGKEL